MQTYQLIECNWCMFCFGDNGLRGCCSSSTRGIRANAVKPERGELPWMTFGLECQLCSACGASEAMTSQWSNLRTTFNNIVSTTSHCSKRDVTMVSGSQATLHTRVPITTATTYDESLIFLHRHSENNTTVILLTRDTSPHTWCI